MVQPGRPPQVTGTPGTCLESGADQDHPEGCAKPGPIGTEVPLLCCTPSQGGVGWPHSRPPLSASPRAPASPLCELRRVYPPTSLFHSGTRAINRTAGTAEPSAAGPGGRRGGGWRPAPRPVSGGHPGCRRGRWERSPTPSSLMPTGRPHARGRGRGGLQDLLPLLLGLQGPQRDGPACR